MPSASPILRRCLLVGLIVTALAVPAAATAGTKSKSATAAGNFSIASATAKCPSGQKATGGGFRSAATQPSVRVFESRKVGQRSWRVTGRVSDLGTGLPTKVTAFAYCAKNAPSTKTRSSSVTATSAASFYAADARCTSGKAQAGGFLGTVPGFSSNYVTDSYRLDKKTWRSRAFLFLFQPGISMTSFVYCADEKSPAGRSASSSLAENDGYLTGLSAECKRDAQPVAGGFSQPNAAYSPLGLFQNFYESLKSGKRWRASAQHNGSSSTTLNTIAYCA